MKSTAMLAIVVLGAAAFAVAGRRESPRQPTTYEPAATPGAALDLEPAEPESSEGDVLNGEVREAFDVAQYTYLRLATPGADTWAAVTKSPVKVGDRVQIDHATRMDNFTSNALKRTFPVIYFGELAQGRAQGLPPGHRPLAGGALPHSTSDAPTDTTLPAVRVPRATGKNAHTIAELYTERSRLEGQLVRVSGQVVKVTNAVMGKNYVRLRDDSVTDATRQELVITTQADEKVGDIVAFQGTLRLEVDVGIGYKYPLLLEDAAPLHEL